MTDLPEKLPWPLIETRWVRADDRPCPWHADGKSEIRREIEAEFQRCIDAPGWNPRSVQMGGKMLAVDYCGFAGGDRRLHSYAVAVVDDHPFLKTLERLPHVPRAVRHIYRRLTRLKYLFAREGWDFLGDMDRADSAWAAYRAALVEGQRQ